MTLNDKLTEDLETIKVACERLERKHERMIDYWGDFHWLAPVSQEFRELYHPFAVAAHTWGEIIIVGFSMPDLEYPASVTALERLGGVAFEHDVPLDYHLLKPVRQMVPENMRRPSDEAWERAILDYIPTIITAATKALKLPDENSTVGLPHRQLNCYLLSSSVYMEARKNGLDSAKELFMRGKESLAAQIHKE